MMNFNVKKIVSAAIIAAIYAVLTMINPFSYGPVQVRVSEALCILPIFTPVAIPGLFVGCVVSNLISAAGVIDIIFGSLTTLVAAFLTYKLRNKKLLALLPPVVLNGLVVGGGILYYFYGMEFSFTACVFFVMLGEAVACYLIGFPLIKIIEKKYKGIF